MAIVDATHNYTLTFPSTHPIYQQLVHKDKVKKNSLKLAEIIEVEELELTGVEELVELTGGGRVSRTAESGRVGEANQVGRVGRAKKKKKTDLLIPIELELKKLE